MFKKIILFSLFLFVFPIFVFPTNASIEDVKFCLNESENKIIVKSSNLELAMNLEKKASFKLYSNNSSLISYHIFFEDCENISIILFKSFDEQIYTAEILVFNENLKELQNSYIKRISKNDYNILIRNTQDVYYESDFGFYLRSNQQKFDEHYQIDDNQPSLFSIERNNKSIEQMTMSDSYLKAYYPTPISESGYPTAYHDNIINIIPEDWFYTVGEKVYLGKEYGVYVSTSKTYHGFFACYCYKSSLTIWDFEASAPFLSERNNGTDSTFSPFGGYKLSIENALEYSYTALKRSDMGDDYWKRYFDASESEIIVQSEDSYKKVYLAPKDFGFAIDNDVSYNYSDLGLNIATLEYELVTSSNIEHELNKLKMQTFVGKSISQMVKFVGTPAVKIGAALANCVINFASAYGKAKLEGCNRDLIYDTNSASIHYDYAGDYDAEGNALSPVAIVMRHSSFSSIFSNSLLKNYKHNFTIRFNALNASNNYYFSFIDNCIFDIYNSDGNVIYTKTRKVEYENLCPILNNRNIEENLYNSKDLNVNISKIGTPNIFVLKANNNGLFKFASNNKDMKIEIYDKDGDLVAQTSQYDFESTCCAYLETGKRYIVRCLFYKNNQTGTGIVSIDFINSSKAITTNTNFAITSRQGMCYFSTVLSRGGIYRFTTSSYYDTTIRLYDEYGNLLGESFDPNADFSEDYPDLGANLSFYSRGINRKVIIEVSNEIREDYQLQITYISTYN